MSYWFGKKILITGGTGFLGRHLARKLKSLGADGLVCVGSRDFDLTRETEVIRMLSEIKPEIVFNLAGLVGGIHANREYPADFLYRNLMIGTLVMHHSCKLGVGKFIAAGAGCSYPEFADMPLKENSMWEGWPRTDNAPYSLAKRMLAVQSAAYFKQYKFSSVICVPGNAYGEYDNFNLTDSHVIPALVRKFVEAQMEGKPTVEVWGSGTPTRDYIYAGDVADGMLRAAETYGSGEVVNISSGIETSVREICAVLKEVTGYKGEVQWLTDKPEGQKRRWFDVSKAKNELGFVAPTDLAAGLKKTADWYRENMNSPNIRR